MLQFPSTVAGVIAETVIRGGYSRHLYETLRRDTSARRLRVPNSWRSDHLGDNVWCVYDLESILWCEHAVAWYINPGVDSYIFILRNMLFI